MEEPGGYGAEERWIFLMYVDYRSLKDVTIKDAYPIPNISSIFDRLAGAEIFTKLYADSGYHQIKMDENCIEKAAFLTNEVALKCVKMPFGFANGLATFRVL